MNILQDAFSSCMKCYVIGEHNMGILQRLMVYVEVDH